MLKVHPDFPSLYLQHNIYNTSLWIFTTQYLQHKPMNACSDVSHMMLNEAYSQESIIGLKPFGPILCKPYNGRAPNLPS